MAEEVGGGARRGMEWVRRRDHRLREGRTH